MENKKNIFLVIFLLAAIIYFAIPSFAAIETDSYRISHDELTKRLKLDNFESQTVRIENKKGIPTSVIFSIDGNISSYAKLGSESATIQPMSDFNLSITFFGDKLGSFQGNLIISGGMIERIPLLLYVSDSLGTPVNALTLKIVPL
ncbi:MAG: hypothetical protein PHV16_01510, partial [Candidatus Nanoarchaeia archaeon]|nr:hypothetical protein [Candidatus Nanoarchaeia archaeon]